MSVGIFSCWPEGTRQKAWYGVPQVRRHEELWVCYGLLDQSKIPKAVEPPHQTIMAGSKIIRGRPNPTNSNKHVGVSDVCVCV